MLASPSPTGGDGGRNAFDASPPARKTPSAAAAASPFRPAVDRRQQATIFACVLGTRVKQLRALLEGAGTSPARQAQVEALLACRRDEETAFDADISEDAARLLGGSTAGMTPLQVALMSLDAEDPTPFLGRDEEELVRSRREIIRMLIESTPPSDLDNITWGHPNNNTTLHLAAFLGEQEAVQLLLDRVAKPTGRNALNFAPIDVAADDETRAIFLRHAEAEARCRPRKFFRKPPLPRAAGESSPEGDGDGADPGGDRPSPAPVSGSAAAAAAPDAASEPRTASGVGANEGEQDQDEREEDSDGNEDEEEDEEGGRATPRPPESAAAGVPRGRPISTSPERDGDQTPVRASGPESPSQSPPLKAVFFGPTELRSPSAQRVVQPLRLRSKDFPCTPSTATAAAEGPVRREARPPVDRATATTLPPARADERPAGVAGAGRLVGTAGTGGSPSTTSAPPAVASSSPPTPAPAVASPPPPAAGVPTTGESWCVVEPLTAVRDNPFFKRLNAPGASPASVPRPQSLIEQWESARKLKKELARREPAHLMAGGGVTSEKAWKEKREFGKAESTGKAELTEEGDGCDGARTPGTRHETADSEGDRGQGTEKKEDMDAGPACADAVLKTLREGDKRSEVEGLAVCAPAAADGSDGETDSERESAADGAGSGGSTGGCGPDSEGVPSADDEVPDRDVSDPGPCAAGIAQRATLPEMNEEDVFLDNHASDVGGLDRNKINAPATPARLCKGVTYKMTVRRVRELVYSPSPIPVLSSETHATKIQQRPLPLPPATHGSRRNATLSSPRQSGMAEKYIITDELEYVQASPFMSGADVSCQGRLYVRLHAIEHVVTSPEVVAAVTGNQGTTGSAPAQPQEPPMVHCIVNCNGTEFSSRPKPFVSGRIVIDEDFDMIANTGASLSIALVVTVPAQRMIRSMDSVDNLSMRSSLHHNPLGRNLRKLFHSPSTQSITTQGEAWAVSRAKAPPQVPPGGSATRLAGPRVTLSSELLADWSRPEHPGSGLNQRWPFTTTVEFANAANPAAPASPRGGKRGWLRGKKPAGDSRPSSALGSRQATESAVTTVGTLKASVAFWPYSASAHQQQPPRAFDECVSALVQLNADEDVPYPPVVLKALIGAGNGLDDLVVRVLEVLRQFNQIKWMGMMSVRFSDSMVWRRRMLAFYPPHLVIMSAPEGASDPLFRCAVDVRRRHTLDAPALRRSKAVDEGTWSPAAHGFRIVFPGRIPAAANGGRGDEGFSETSEPAAYAVEFSAETAADAAGLVGAVLASSKA